MVYKIFRWINGYVIFIVTGSFPERFINLMNINGIRYWQGKPCDNGFTGAMKISDYFKIRKLARKSKVKLKIKSKVGLPFFTIKYKKRKGILVGLAVAILIILFLNQFVWVIDIEGENSLGEYEIMNVLNENGLYVGAYKNSLDLHKIERDTLLKITDLKWMSVNLLNNVAKIEVNEKANKPKITPKYPCNIKAKCDGIVTKTSVANGTSQVKVGSAVAKNQILISSIMQVGEENLKYVHSQGEILADVEYKKVFSINKNEKYLLPESYISKKEIKNFLWFSFPTMASSSLNGEKVSVYRKFVGNINNVNLPLYSFEEKSYYYTNCTYKRDYKKILMNKLNLYEIFAENESEIKSRSIHFREDATKLTLSAEYLINKNIGEIQKIYITP